MANRIHDIKGLPNDLLTNEVYNERKLKTDGTPKDYFIEVAEGNVEGASLTASISKNRVTGTVYEDVSGFGGVMFPASPPTVAETYEIRSDNINDTDGGSGTRTILINSLADDFTQQTRVVTLDGTNWVTVTGTHIRPRSIVSLTAGSNGINLGNITLRETVGQATRNYMAADDGSSYDSFFTVPAGKKAYLLQTFTLYAKDDAGDARTKFRLNGDDSSWVVNAPVPIYQNLITFEVKALQAFPPKTDINFQARSATGTADVTVIFEWLLLDE